MSTQTQTHTFTHARHIASKVAADLKRFQRLYRANRPSDEEIEAYQAEVFMLLNAGYLGEVTYGFKRNGKWVAALKYHAVGNQLSGGGDDPGGIRATENVAGLPFTSFLTHSYAWTLLSRDQREAFEATLPFRRGFGDPPGIEGGGHWVAGRNYVSGPFGVQRSTIQR